VEEVANQFKASAWTGSEKTERTTVRINGLWAEI
jgi:hypothetical protein